MLKGRGFNRSCGPQGIYVSRGPPGILAGSIRGPVHSCTLKSSYLAFLEGKKVRTFGPSIPTPFYFSTYFAILQANDIITIIKSAQ